jgi:protocatechuate 3,4-dioxygenase beta subunit
MNRRQAIAAFGTVSLGTLLASCGEDDTPTATTSTGSSSSSALDEAGSCRLTAEQTEGPYYFDVDKIRSDIREDREGATLKLALRVRNAESCEPIANAVVDIWHCDASGVYSGFESGEGEEFLRGVQVTDKEGIAEFTTIYPGWYQGRTVHIHAKVHLDKQTVLTTQLYFPEDVSEKVYANAPYRQGRDQFNASDGIFDESLILTVKPDGDGYLGAIGFDVT